MLLDELRLPIVLAPLAGGASTPELAAAVSTAGGFGFLGAGYLPAAELADRLAATRRLTHSSFGVNLFVPGPGGGEPAGLAAYVERLRGWAEPAGVPIGEPRWDDDGYAEKLELLTRARPRVVSFTFGCPDAPVVERLRAGGGEVWVTVTGADEARLAEAAGADVLVVQGAEAGGHQGSFTDGAQAAPLGLLPLLTLVRRVSRLPLVAAGGLATGEAVAGVLAAGAAAAQLGTAFLLAPEAGTSAAHREALARPGPTVLTRAFTGRLARGIPNRFIEEHESAAPLAYPEVHHLTAPLRRQARERGDAEMINLWAGEAHELAEPRPAGETARRLGEAAVAALERARKRLG